MVIQHKSERLKQEENRESEEFCERRIKMLTLNPKQKGRFHSIGDLCHPI